ncbi:MAG: anaerobic ribonucleoside-triphosphate reductase [Fibrobacterales bacterium]
MTHTILKNSERTKCEIWTRVMGYHRPVSEFNIGKQSEYAERTVFNERVAQESQEKSAVA